MYTYIHIYVYMYMYMYIYIYICREQIDNDFSSRREKWSELEIPRGRQVYFYFKLKTSSGRISRREWRANVLDSALCIRLCVLSRIGRRFLRMYRAREMGELARSIESLELNYRILSERPWRARYRCTSRTDRSRDSIRQRGREIFAFF